MINSSFYCAFMLLICVSWIKYDYYFVILLEKQKIISFSWSLRCKPPRLQKFQVPSLLFPLNFHANLIEVKVQSTVTACCKSVKEQSFVSLHWIQAYTGCLVITQPEFNRCTLFVFLCLFRARYYFFSPETYIAIVKMVRFHLGTYLSFGWKLFCSWARYILSNKVETKYHEMKLSLTAIKIIL